MHMLAELVEVVIGVDTHKHTHTAAVVTAATGAVIAQATVPATPAGYRQLLDLADQHHGQRVGDRGHRGLWRWPDPLPALPV
jgi:transposase